MMFVKGHSDGITDRVLKDEDLHIISHICRNADYVGWIGGSSAGFVADCGTLPQIQPKANLVIQFGNNDVFEVECKHQLEELGYIIDPNY